MTERDQTERTPAAADDRRTDDGLAFDRVENRLRLGSSSVVLAVDADNAAVLAAYVELVGRTRGARPGGLPDVRDADLAALAEALDLDAGDLEAQVQAALGAPAPEARRLVSRLRDHRLVTGLAAVAVAATLAGTVAYGAGPGTAAPKPDRAASSTGPVASPPRGAVPGSAPTGDGATPSDGHPSAGGGAVTETADGVGLIPALQEDADGVGLIPAVQVDVTGATLVPAASVEQPPPSD